METCLWCDTDKDGERVDKGKDYICGSCVQMLLSYPQDALNKTYHKCLRLNLTRKANAIETFLEEVRYDGDTGNERGWISGRSIDDRGGIVKSPRRTTGDRETATLRG